LASPVISGNKAFYFDNQAGKETLHAIGAGDAREIWRAVVDDALRDEQGPAGPRCTPVVDGDLVFAQSGMGELQCLRVADGRCVWHVNFTNDFGAAFLGEDTVIPGAAEHGFTGAPVVADHRLIACAGGTNGSGVVCFDKRSGKVQWRSQNDRASYAAPIIATLAGMRQAVCFTVEGLIGLGLDEGRLLWRFPLKTAYGRNCTTPAVLGDYVVVGSYKAGLVGVRVSADGADLRAERAWVNKDLSMNFSSPVIAGRHLFGLGPGRRVVCVEPETGRLAWAKEGYVTTPSEVAHASFMVLEDNVLVCTDTGELVLIAADPAGPRELGRAQVCGPNWCYPAYADGRLYLRDGFKNKGNLYCLELFR
jgi:outer membrane protein assembly factor BamB